MTTLDITTTERSDGVLLELAGELDLATAPKLEDELKRLEEDTPPTIFLDLRPLSFMDSSGLQALVQYAATLDGGGPLVLDRVPAHIGRLFALTGMDDMAQIELRDGDQRG
jgi:anti-sigma B factor antagonist